ncbi:hypothetical protein ACFLZ7_02790 [Nanoarchaeota archaeon]
MSWSEINDADGSIEELRRLVKIVKEKRGLKSIHQLRGQDEVRYNQILGLAQKAFTQVLRVDQLVKRLSAKQKESISKKFTEMWKDLQIALSESDLMAKKNKLVPINVKI